MVRSSARRLTGWCSLERTTFGMSWTSISSTITKSGTIRGAAGRSSNPETRSVWPKAGSAEGNVSAACLTTIIGTLLEHPFEFLDTTGDSP